ncbi:MAG: RNA-binding S4 domain-containing protein [Proteobacteria bacterium]|nr:RNA-binding S4 domain-containing protein [Pseudomonadota bacterium]
MRIDKLLWFLRLSKTRGAAQILIGQGHIRLNGRRIERAAQAVAVGDIMVLPTPRGVLVIELLAQPHRRGPAAEAQSCYRVLDEGSANPIAGIHSTPEGTVLP